MRTWCRVAILTFLFRLRIGVLVLLALATAAAAFVTFHDHPVPVGALFLGSASLLMGAVLAFVHLRHWGVAMLTALAPLPGMIATGPFAVQSGLPFSGFLASYGFAYLAAACLGGRIVRRILGATDPAVAGAPRTARCSCRGGFSILVGAALVVGWLFQDARMLGEGGAAALVAAALSVLVFVPLVSAILPFGENFFVSANRAHERRERLLRVASMVVEPRWGMSLTGITLVFATLGGFGVQPTIAHSALLAQPVLWGASALLVFLMAFAVGRDWREALAATLALGTLTLLFLFLWSRAAGHLTVSSFIEIAIAAAASLFLMLLLIARSRGYRQTGDARAVARLRAIEDIGVAPWFGVSGAATAILPWMLLHGSVAMLAAMILFAGTAALLAMPSLATALDMVVPRRRSVEELYGRG